MSEMVEARVFNGKIWKMCEIEIYSRKEAKKIIAGRRWEIGYDVFGVNANGTCGDRIAFVAEIEDGRSIYVSTSVK